MNTTIANKCWSETVGVTYISINYELQQKDNTHYALLLLQFSDALLCSGGGTK